MTERVLQVVTSMDPGGIETMLMATYRSIDRSTFQFDFLTHRQSPGRFEAEIVDMGGRIFRMPQLRSVHLLSYTRQTKLFLSQHPEYRIVHSHLNQYSHFPLRGALLAGVPIRIAHSHQNVGNDGQLPVSRAILTKYCKSRIGLDATHRLACSSEAGRWLYGDSLSFDVFRNAIDVEAFRFSLANRERVRTELNLGGSFVVGHVGNFSEPKNYPFLLDAFSRIASMNDSSVLLLVGNSGKSPAIVESIADKGLEGRVILTGIRSDIPALLHAMDAFVFPSTREGLPVSVIEAQAAGLPCLVSDSVTAEVRVTDRVTLLPLAAGPDNWAKTTLSSYTADRSRAADLVRSAGYDIVANAKVLEQIYLTHLGEFER